MPSTLALGIPNAPGRSAMFPAVTVSDGENSEKPLCSQINTSGSFHSAPTFSASMNTPWFAAPSPKKHTATWPLFSS